MDGQSALEAVAEDLPDLVLLDIMMPDMDGYTVCKKLKAGPATDEIPITFLTALTEVDSKARGFDVGAVDCITKPFEIAEVKARVRTHLALVRARQELKNRNEVLERKVIERARELALTQEVTIESMASLAEYRDPETGGHIRRTQHYVKAPADKLLDHPAFASELDSRVISQLFISAPLHDIGKVGVNDSILLKPGKLTDEEFEEMKKHTEFGSNAIKAAEKRLGEETFLSYARQIALGHHEKWDGSGYPQGLAGSDIPMPARLMAVADVYDALISRRVYKPPFPHSKAVAIIKEGRGSHFDTDMVDAFLSISEEFRSVAHKFADHEEERESLMK